MSEKFSTEKDGQIDFYNQFLPRINPTITVDEIIANNNDGVLNGNLIEFKLSVKDLNEVLFQCIKYLSALRIKGAAPYFWDSPKASLVRSCASSAVLKTERIFSPFLHQN